MPKLKDNSKVEWISVVGPFGELEFRFYERRVTTDRTSMPEYKNIGIVYLDEHCEEGSSAGIAEFYKKYFNAIVKIETDKRLCRVRMGPRQEFIFREVKPGEKLEKWCGYHICIYISEFAEVFNRFKAEDLLYKHNRFPDKYDTLEAALSEHQFRISDIVANDKKVIHQLEHEVRSLAHPYYKRALVNRMGNAGILI